ncbi:MAG: NAD(P)-dependent alcohol dehydrogenase [Chloroflexi bacterium]|nr:NAD(P)-dependent alcohol dehydrogenase [Chloroflexota bacterium]
MKAIVHTQYGPPHVLKLVEVEKPTPQDNQVLVKVHAASINAGDTFARGGKPFLFRFFTGGFLKPKNTRLGSDIAGQVEAVGENVKQFRPGDEVFGCARGAFAEYVLAREAYLAFKPTNISYEQAAAVPWAALVALQTIRYAGEIQPGQKVLIQGASGGVGSFAIQIVKAFGAEVTAVCSTRNQEMARSIGADHVIDYTREDFTRNPQRYDLILAINGYHSLSTYKRALNPQGMYLCGGGTISQILQARLFGSFVSSNGGKQVRMMGSAKIIQEDLVFLAKLLKEGKIIPVIDGSYPLSEIVEAFRYIEGTHAQGKVVIKIT